MRELTALAGSWPAGASGGSGATGAVVADRFDAMTWREAYEELPALRELARSLNDRHHHTGDLLADVFLLACKAAPQLRERAAMAPGRLLNHQVVGALRDSPDFAALHRETCGDPYASAHAVLAQAAALRLLLEHASAAAVPARRAEAARQEAGRAAAAVGGALESAAGAAGPDGSVPEAAAAAVSAAVRQAAAAEEAAEDAERQAGHALDTAAPGMRAQARGSVAAAAESAGRESALMRAWGVGEGELRRMPYARRALLAERLRSGRLGRFADLIGRFRLFAEGERSRGVEEARGELVGVTLGDDLSRVVPSELAQLGVPELRSVFAARYAEARLMLYDSRGEESTGKGAVIACVDCSSSMEEAGPGGVTREAWAKACALALLEQARRSGRDFVGVLFSSAESVRVFRFPAGRPAGVDRVLEFTEHFFGGGTNYRAPLSAAVRVLDEEFNTEGRRRGDIVMITDGECGVTEAWMRSWNDAKQTLGFRAFGLAVGAPRAAAPGRALDALCDQLRTVGDLTDVRAVGDLFRVL